MLTYINMPVIYVLKLKGGKYYIGKTTNPHSRFEQHETGKGSAWTKLHEPLELIDTMVQDMRFTELAITLKYMKKYGKSVVDYMVQAECTCAVEALVWEDWDTPEGAVDFDKVLVLFMEVDIIDDEAVGEGFMVQKNVN